MSWLISGLAVFFVIHLASATLPGTRRRLKESLGAGAYRAIYSIVAAVGLALIVLGWRWTVPVALFAPPAWGMLLALPLMFLSVLLFGASHAKTNIKRVVRHPQLSAVLVWSIAHLLSNGDLRSLILFGSLGVWAALEIALINRRDGEWVKPAPAPLAKEAIALAISTVVYLVLFALHPYFAGVSPLG